MNYSYGYLYMLLRDHVGTHMVTADQVFKAVIIGKIDTIGKIDLNATRISNGIIRDRFDYNASTSDNINGIIARISRGNECIYLEFDKAMQSVIEHKYVINNEDSVESRNSMKAMKIDRSICYIWDVIIVNKLLNDFINEITGRAPDILDGLEDDEDLESSPYEMMLKSINKMKEDVK